MTEQQNNTDQRNTSVIIRDLMAQPEDKISLPDVCAEYLNNIYGRIIFWLGLS